MMRLLFLTETKLRKYSTCCEGRIYMLLLLSDLLCVCQYQVAAIVSFLLTKKRNPFVLFCLEW